MGIVSLVLLLMACTGVPSEQGTPTPTAESQPRSTTPLASPSPQAMPSSVAEADGYILTVTTDRLTVSPGETIEFSATFHNGTAQPIDVAGPACGGGLTGWVFVDLPQGPTGRTWSGIRQRFKDYVLKEGYGPGGVPALAPLRISVSPPSCADWTLSSELGPGKSITVTMPWKSEIVPGIGALPGLVPFTVSVGYDLQNGPPSYPPDYKGPHGSWSPMFKELAVDGQFEVVGQGRALAGPGEVIDAVIANKKFASWLGERPASTWSNANLFLSSMPAASGILPKGAFWDLDLFREIGVPRHWAIAIVDPFDASLISINYCDIPCDR